MQHIGRRWIYRATSKADMRNKCMRPHSPASSGKAAILLQEDRRVHDKAWPGRAFHPNARRAAILFKLDWTGSMARPGLREPSGFICRRGALPVRQTQTSDLRQDPLIDHSSMLLGSRWKMARICKKRQCHIGLSAIPFFSWNHL